MKKPRILPGAAGIIALTATIGFIDGQCDLDTENFSRGRIALTQSLSGDTVSGDPPNFKPDNPAYLVEVRRGNTFAEVKIDAITGRVLLS